MKNRRTIKSTKDPYANLTLLRRSIQRYPDDPGKVRLEAFANPYPRRNYWIHFDCPEFMSLCPITGQPDFGAITIDYIPARLCLESKALKFYLFSYRNVGMFYETAVNCILEDIVRTCRPRRLKVNGKFNPRGGISITVSAEYP